MTILFDTRTFYFNADTDFLAYYKNHMVKIDETLKVKDLLTQIQTMDPLFSFKKTSTMVQINGVSVKGSLSLKEVVKLFGKSLTIEPISTFRAVKDMNINDDDFIQKHTLLEAYGDEEDFKYYKTLIREYYASGSLQYNQDYFGDSMFIYAHYLMEKYPEKGAEILNVIDDRNGIWLYEKECTLYPDNDTATKVSVLKAQLTGKSLKKYTPESMAYYDKAELVLAKRFDVEKDEDCALETIMDNIGLEKIKSELKHAFEDFSVAFYAGSFDCKDIAEVESEAETLLKTIGAKVVRFASSDAADGFDIAPYDDMAYKKAGSIVLDAFDSGAEILVVDSKESHFMMDQSVKACACATGRDIRIPILNVSQIVALAVGITDIAKLGLDAHKIKPEFI
ncbi:MAG: DUF5644 domain-containing protein [Epsilonproteobacteria bacterium]|nr:DUF5644 domain-containing protein [Campylobacterota bacterium]